MHLLAMEDFIQARTAAAVLLAVSLGLAPATAHAAAVDLYYERTALGAADARCRYFAPPVAAALQAGAVQARGAALRGGADPEELRRVGERARSRAARVDCADPAITAAAARAREAFEGYARLGRLTYPGDLADWRADRYGGREPRWRLVQQVRSGRRDPVAFGLAGRADALALLAVAKFDGEAPYAARLLLRDSRRSPRPYLDVRHLGATRALPLDRRLPPPSAMKVFLASARIAADADLPPADASGGWAFRFPDAAVQALGELDPREAVAVEFLFPGDRSRRAYVEVGDFAAAQAFLQIAGR